MVVRITICDDTKRDRTKLKKLIEEYCKVWEHELILSDCASGEEYLEYLEKGEEADILLLDEEMPGIGGMELKDRLFKSNSKTLILFVTSHDEIIGEAYGIGVVGFITKPIDKEWLYKKMDDAILGLSRYRKQDVNEKKTNSINDILYITVKDKCSKIYTKDGLTQFAYKTLNSYKEELKEDFFMTDKSYLINLQYAGNIVNEKMGDKNRSWIKLVGTDILIPLSRRRRKNFEIARRNYNKKGLIN